MIDQSFNTPVVFIIFNRPESTLKVFEQISRIKPSNLFVIADGPRPNKINDINDCELTRKVIDNVDWPCNIYKNYSDINLGCGKRVTSGLDWVFENVESAIILEDDCLPHNDFFIFCETLLKKYENNDNIFSICGSNFLKGKYVNHSSYYYSSHFHVWGWATWKRAWKLNDFEASGMSIDNLKYKLNTKFKTKAELKFYKKMFFDMKNKNVDTWDYQWFFTHIYFDGLTIIPNYNLISNIGPNGAHFKNDNLNPRINLPTHSILPIKYPNSITIDIKADYLLYQLNFKTSKISYIKNQLYSFKNYLIKIVKSKKINN
jgi:hypothetical protein